MFDKPIQLTWRQVWGAITVVAILISATAVTTWEIRKDALEDLKRRLDAFEKSKDWRLPETLSAVREATQQLALSVKERKELDQLRTDRATLSKRLSEGEGQLKATEEKLAELQTSLRQVLVPARSFVLAEGESAALVENAIFVGVTGLYSTWSTIVLEGISQRLNVGDSREYRFADKRCRLTLLKIAEENATFSNVCA